MKPFASPSVSIDGQRIRQIREDGRLTQLYVAKVVGVTTDTVSRWENNRYPTIRRDNALKLAEALEVSLEAILKQDEDSETDEDQTPEPRKHLVNFLLLAGLLVVIAILVYFSLTPEPLPENLVKGHRHVPNFTAPGTRVPIRLEITSEQSLKGLIVRESYPAGWNLVESDPPAASIDNLSGSVRWMIRNPLQHKQIVYVLQAPEKVAMGTEVALTGEVVANPNGQRFSTEVNSTGVLKVQPLHWADMDGNAVIDDLEILEVSDLVDESEKIHYNWDLIETMWDAGGYEFDAKTHQYKARKPQDAKVD